MKRLKLKRITINGLMVLLVIALGCFLNNSCIATASQLSNIEHSGTEYSELEQYITLTRNRIKNNWYPPASSFENSAILGLSINKSGKLVNCSIIKPSPDEGFNNSLIEAAKKTTFLPLPKDFIEDTVDFSFEFGMQRRNIEKK